MRKVGETKAGIGFQDSGALLRVVFAYFKGVLT